MEPGNVIVFGAPYVFIHKATVYGVRKRNFVGQHFWPDVIGRL